MDPQYGACYRTFHEQHWWFQTRAKWIIEYLQQHVSQVGPTSILDVGCGDGLFFDQLLKFGEVTGLETSPEIISSGNPHRQRIHIGPLDSSFQPAEPFSLILMLDVIEHISQPLVPLRRSAELLRPGGYLLLTVPAFNAVWTNHDVINHHITRYKRSSLFPLLLEAGYTIVESEYWFHWTFPMKFAQRVVERALRLRPSNPIIPSASVNRVLRALCDLERFFLRRMHLSFGTTLFVRCVKKPDLVTI